MRFLVLEFAVSATALQNQTPCDSQPFCFLSGRTTCARITLLMSESECHVTHVGVGVSRDPKGAAFLKDSYDSEAGGYAPGALSPSPLSGSS
eukprot:2896478-Rhodomonas_salina.1